MEISCKRTLPTAAGGGECALIFPAGLAERCDFCYTLITSRRTAPDNLQKEIHNMTYTYHPTGVCSSQIDLELEDGIIRSVVFTGGCNGNLQGIARLVAGMDAREAIGKLQGIQCGWKPTSCPDQLSKALLAALDKEEK